MGHNAEKPNKLPTHHDHTNRTHETECESLDSRPNETRTNIHEQQISNTKQPSRTQMMMSASGVAEEEINGEMALMNAMAMRRYGTGDDNSCKRE